MSCDDSVIQVENVSKYFEIYRRPEDRLKQMLMPRLRRSIGLTSDLERFHRKFWALKDVSLSVGKGEAVGIIGQNGSGKSTLLQIITGTMAPSSGQVTNRGTVAALLELGSGFNPEFTGRENVYLNANLLGLTTEQTDARFDEIAAFADIGEHIDQPVKTYSSGMTLRLAFAVQATVEAEIIIIDEALSVGDARFQLKCFRRLDEMKERGSTILFVSHATDLVRSFCNRGLLLNKGEAIYWGDARTATVKYLEILFPEKHGDATNQAPTERPAETPTATPALHPESQEFTHEHSLFIDAATLDAPMFGVGGAQMEWLKINGLQKPNLLIGGSPVTVEARFSWQKDAVESLIISEGYDNNITLGIAIANHKGSYIFGCNGFDFNLDIDCLKQQQSTVQFDFKLPYLASGEYFLTVAIALGRQKHHVQLRWYDCFMQLKSLETDKNVYGVFAIDYSMTLVNRTENNGNSE